MKEALRMALEALERVNTVDDDCDILSPSLADAVVNAIDDIKEALANHIEDNLAMVAQPEQEPAAWMTQAHCFVHLNEFTEAEAKLYGWKPLYTTLPQRTWIGLTDEELTEGMKYWSDDSRSAYGGAYAAEGEYFDVEESWRYIEAKLKAKNFSDVKE